MINKNFNTLTVLSLGLALASVANAGRGSATGRTARNAAEATKVAAVNLSDALGGSVKNTRDSAVAILDKQGNLLQVLVTGKKAKTVYSAMLEASAGAGEDVSGLALDFTKQGVAITGGAARYAIEMGLGSLSKLGEGTRAGNYTLVPLAGYTSSVVNSMVDYVESDANLVVEISERLIKDSHSLIRSIVTAKPAQAGKSLKGIAKTGINAPIQVTNTVTRLLGFEFKTF